MSQSGEYGHTASAVILRLSRDLLIRSKCTVQAVAVHRRRRRCHRAPPLRPRSRPPQRPLHVRQAKASNRLRIYLSIPVSSYLAPLASREDRHTHQILNPA